MTLEPMYSQIVRKYNLGGKDVFVHYPKIGVCNIHLREDPFRSMCLNSMAIDEGGWIERSEQVFFWTGINDVHPKSMYSLFMERLWPQEDYIVYPIEAEYCFFWEQYISLIHYLLSKGNRFELMQTIDFLHSGIDFREGFERYHIIESIVEAFLSYDIHQYEKKGIIPRWKQRILN